MSEYSVCTESTERLGLLSVSSEASLVRSGLEIIYLFRVGFEIISSFPADPGCKILDENVMDYPQNSKVTF